MKIRVYFCSCFLLVAFFFGIDQKTAFSQEKDVVLVDGNPPLTQSMFSKNIILLEWSLDIKFSEEQLRKIAKEMIGYWNAGDRTQIKNVVEIVEMVDQLKKVSAEDRNKAKDILREELLKNLRFHPENELNEMVLEAYEAAHPANPQNFSPADGASALPSSSSAEVASGQRLVGEDGFSGIYIGIYNPPPGAAINSVQTAFVTFLPDGYVYWMLPPEGLLYFDPRVAQRAYPDDWGTYKIVGNQIQVTLGRNNLRRVFVREGNKLKLQDYESQYRAAAAYTYSPLATGDGLKLNGTYRRYTDAPGITFASDGRFSDQGFTRNFGTIGRPDGTTYQDDARGGSGTYLIAQNTLELSYSDGRVKRFAFTALPANLARQPVQSFRINYEIFKLD